MAETYNAPSIDEYLLQRLMPVEGAIPHVQGIEMYGNAIPAGTFGGNLSDAGDRREDSTTLNITTCYEQNKQPTTMRLLSDTALEYIRRTPNGRTERSTFSIPRYVRGQASREEFAE
jgi:hypothetical protein